MPRFNPNVRYQIRREGGRYIVINLDRNRRMNKTHATRREAQAHINETKRRVSQIIGYHNRAPAAAQRNNRRAPPPANRRPVANVGRTAVAGRRGRPPGARNRNAGGGGGARTRNRGRAAADGATNRNRGGAGPSNARTRNAGSSSSTTTTTRLRRTNTVETPARRPGRGRPRTQGLARRRPRRGEKPIRRLNL